MLETYSPTYTVWTSCISWLKMATIDILSETQINSVYPKPNNSKLRILKPDQQLFFQSNNNIFS